jgi:Spy/CpxP family protein refolding chaperone
LLLTNIGVLVYFLTASKDSDKSQNQHRDRGGLTDMLRDDVGFNDEQVNRYKELKDEQWNTIRPMFDDMRKAKDSLFRMISSDNTSDSSVNAVGDAIAKKQKEMDLRMYSHFKRIRSLCTPAQLPKYDSVIQRMMRKMGKPRRDPDRKDGK